MASPLKCFLFGIALANAVFFAAATGDALAAQHQGGHGPGGLGPVHGPGSSHNPIVFHPRRIRPPIVKPGPAKAPPFYICPGCADPNRPPGTPITEDSGGKHCTFLNGYNGGCDPNIPDTGVHGSGGLGHGRHHLN